MLEILGKASSINVRKVLWTSSEIGLQYQRDDWGAGFRDTSDAEFLALNPNAMVPVIRDEGFVLWESNAVCRYLAMKHGRADLLPVTAAGRALVEQWMDWQATELNNSWRYAFMALVRKSPNHRETASVSESVSNWNRHMGILERQLAATTAFVVGAEFTLADVVIGLSVNRWLMTPIEHADCPNVQAYYGRLRSRPGFMLHCGNGLP